MSADYIIIGQGLCGTWLSYYLIKEGAQVIVVDGGTRESASSAASGIINPITGKRLARQWMGETILPFAATAYEAMGSELSVLLAEETAIHNFFAGSEEAAFFEAKAAASGDDLLSYSSTVPGAEHFNYHYGAGSIFPAMLVNVRALLQGWRKRLQEQGTFIEDAFSWNDCKVSEAGVEWKERHAKAVIDCTGAATMANPYFNALPFALNRGEAITAFIPGLPRRAIYKHGQLSIVPWEGDTFWIGSTFNWDYPEALPTAAFREKVMRTLDGWLRIPYTLAWHFAAVRPATVTRDAFAGLHPKYPSVGILNGMGSKGCSLAPFLAQNLASHLVNGTPVIAQVDVSRYARVLAR